MSCTAAAVVAAVVFCAAAPCRPEETGPPARPSPASGEFSLGVTVSLELEKRLGRVPDDELLERLNRIGLRLAAASSQTRVPYSFDILKMREPNAMALPGGFIYVTSGLLDLGLDDDELASVLGHEVAHVSQRHLLKRRTANNLLNLLAAIAIMSMPRPEGQEPISFGGREMPYAEAVTRAQVLALRLSQLMLEQGYSRGQEREADRIGQRYAARAGFDPGGVVGLLEKLREKERRSPYSLQGLFRSHPHFKERVRSGARRRRTLPRRTVHASGVPAGRLYQQMLFSSAEEYRRRKEWKEAELLYRKASAIFPEGPLADDALLGIVYWQQAEMEKEVQQKREPARILRELEAILKKYPDSDRKEEVEELRARYDRESSARYSWYERKMAEGSQPVDFYRSFLRWYPDSPFSGEAGLRLARSMVLASDYDGAAGRYMDWVEKSTEDTARQEVMDSLGELIARWESPETALRYMELVRGTGREAAARERLKELLRKGTDIKELAGMLGEKLDEDVEEVLHGRLEEVAESTLFRARAFEMVGDTGKALELYRLIVEYAGNTKSAGEALATMKRLKD